MRPIWNIKEQFPVLVIPDNSAPHAIEHPLHAEAVRELSVIVAPGLDAERGRHFSATCQLLEQPSGLLAVLYHEDMRGASHRFGIVIVGSVEQHARSFELCVHDLAAHRLALCGHSVLAIT